MRPLRQGGLTLARFWPHSEPFLVTKTTQITQCMPQKKLRLSQEVGECKPLPGTWSAFIRNSLSASK